MKFRSQFQYHFPGNKIDFNSQIGFIGSCFSDRIGKRMEDAQFKVQRSFFGTLFNPYSIFSLISDSVQKTPFNASDAVVKDGKWVHYSSHSKCEGATKEELLQSLVEEQHRFHLYLEKADTLFITLGSSFAYKVKESGKIVANCHKQPQNLFDKVLLGANTIFQQAEQTLKLLWELNPKLQVVFTISPVKHLKDGVVNNKLSKAMLCVLCHQVSSTFSQVHYLPVLEWVEEDLRDYRFYEADLAHPNAMAEQYIWEQFCAAFLNENDVATANKNRKQLWQQQLTSDKN